MQKTTVRYVKNGKQVSMSKRYAHVLLKMGLVEPVGSFSQTQGFQKIEKPLQAPIVKNLNSAILNEETSKEIAVKSEDDNETAEEKPTKSVKAPRKPKKVNSEESPWLSVSENRTTSFSLKKSEDKAE